MPVRQRRSAGPLSLPPPLSFSFSSLVHFIEDNISALRHYDPRKRAQKREIRSWSRPDDIRIALSWINWNSFGARTKGSRHGRRVRLIDNAFLLLPDIHSRITMLGTRKNRSTYDLRERFFKQAQILWKKPSFFNFYTDLIYISLFILIYHHDHSGAY